MLYYSVALEREPDAAGYTAWVPALPDCRAREDTINEAIAAVREEIEARLRRLAEEGRPPPDDVASLVVSVAVSAPPATRPSVDLDAPAPAQRESA